MKNTEKLLGVIAILLVITIVGGFIGYNQLSNQIRELNRQQENMTSSIASISGNVYASIQSAQEADANKVDGYTYTFSKYDMDTEKISTDFEIILKEVKAEAKIFLILKDDKEGKEVQIPLVNKMALTFTGSTDLDINKNYGIRVIEELQDGGKTQLNYVSLNAYLKDQFSQNRIIDMSMSGSEDNEQRSENRTFVTNSYGIEAFEVDKIMLHVLFRGETIDTYEVTDDVFLEKSIEALDALVVASSDEPLAPEERPMVRDISTEEIEKNILYSGYFQEGMLKPDLTYYMHTFHLNYKSDYPELKLTEEEAREITVEYHIIYKDGSEGIVGMY